MRCSEARLPRSRPTIRAMSCIRVLPAASAYATAPAARSTVAAPGPASRGGSLGDLRGRADPGDRPRARCQSRSRQPAADRHLDQCRPAYRGRRGETWSAIQPSAEDVMAARGAVPASYADRAAAYPDLFGSAEAARERGGGRNPGKTSIGNPYDVLPGFYGGSSTGATVVEDRPAGFCTTRSGSNRRYGWSRG